MPGIEIAVWATWLWEKFGKEMTQSATGTLQKKWKTFKYKSAAQTYAQQMKKRYGKMQLWKMSAPTDVEEIFTQVNILQKQSAFQNVPKEQLEKIYLNQSGFGEVVEKGKDGMATVREHNRLFILGKPGAGKTTFLKHITLQAITGKLEAIPIFVKLREFSESKQSLMDFVIDQFDICNFPEAQPFIETILKKGKAIVLFDGLDEVNKEDGLRDTVIQAIKNFSDKYDQSKVLITCRIAATEYNFEGFTIVEMADFDDKQIKAFVTKWFASDKETSACFLIAFEKQAGTRLRDLAKTPLLLTLLCIGFEDTRRFSNRRSEIYGEALDALLKRRDRADGIERDEIYQKLSLGRKKQMFARIAAETFKKSDYLIKRHHLEKKIVDCLQNLLPGEEAEDIDGEEMLKAIEAQHGIFVECAKDIYSFAHLSFQEYYAARYIVAQPQSRLPRLMKYVDDPRWREVFILTAEMLDDADGFFEHFIIQLDEDVSKKEKLNALLIRKNGGSFEERKNSFSLILLSAVVIPSCGFTGMVIRSRAFHFILKLDCQPLLSLVLAVAHIQAGIFGCDNSWYEKALFLSQEEGFEECHDSLTELYFPPKNASIETWKTFADALYEIFRMTFKVEDYDFSEEEKRHIIKYLETIKLLTDSLSVANVSDREAIEDQLLRPPKN